MLLICLRKESKTGKVRRLEINLVRHGKSLYNDKNRITVENYKIWSEYYDSSGVNIEKSYPAFTLEKVSSANLLLTSCLKRAIDSAAYLSPNSQVAASSLFRETELPLLKGFGRIKLRPVIWEFLLRALWLAGFSSKCESFKEAQYRAQEAADILIEFAGKYSKVTLVGHGFFNYLIASELKKHQWKAGSRISFKHWVCTSFKK